MAWADHATGYMAPCGWPTCEAKIADCEIVRRSTDAECNTLVEQLAKSGRTDAHKAATLRALHEKNGKGERIVSRKQTDHRFWRIKKGEPIPEWLQKGATAAGMVAGDDLIVIPSETEGYDVYLADPNSSGPMIRVTAENIPEGFLVIGAPTCFHMASSLHYTIGTLREENEALKKERDEARNARVRIADDMERAEIIAGAATLRSLAGSKDKDGRAD